MINPDRVAAIRSKDMDDSTVRGVTRKRNAEDSSFKSRKKGTAAITKSFEGRCKELVDFMNEFGHCNVPSKYPANPTLGHWCGTMRYRYNQIQQGQTLNKRITQDQIERLEELGFKWKVQKTLTFEQRCRDLEAFKREFGHCYISCRYSADPSLGNWCHKLRSSYNKIQQGQTPKRKLTQDQIEHLEEIGFQWKPK